MKQIVRILLIFPVFALKMAFASIDTNGELFSTTEDTACQSLSVNQSTSGREIDLPSGNPTNLQVFPLEMNRDFSIMTHFSVLPQDYQMTVKQFLLTYEVSDKAEISAQIMRSDKLENSGQEAQVGLRAPFLPVASMSEMFVQMEQSHELARFSPAFSSSVSSEGSAPVTVGTRGKGSFGRVSWKSEFAYEDYLAADVIGSPAFKAALCGTVKMNDSALSSEFNVNLFHAGKNSLEEELHFLDKKRIGSVFSPMYSNLSVVNTQLACNPRKNLFLSVDYYYYLQNELKVQSYGSESSISEVAWTNGKNNQLGEELNLKAMYAYSEDCRSELLAGWFDPGAAFGKIEDTKTFEIRGEIIVNF